MSVDKMGNTKLTWIHINCAARSLVFSYPHRSCSGSGDGGVYNQGSWGRGGGDTRGEPHPKAGCGEHQHILLSYIYSIIARCDSKGL